jgi:YD repeat-containing protein
MINNNGVETLYYGYTDNQGSLIALTDENGTAVERYAYDAWGARHNPDNWAEKDSRISWLVNRGYTGHEHLSPSTNYYTMIFLTFDKLPALS